MMQSAERCRAWLAYESYSLARAMTTGLSPIQAEEQKGKTHTWTCYIMLYSENRVILYGNCI